MGDHMKIRLLLCLLPLSLAAEFDLESLSLETAEQIALECNKEYRIVEESTVQAYERNSQALARWFPSIKYQAEYRQAQRSEIFFNVYEAFFPFSHRGYRSILEFEQPILSMDLLTNLLASGYEAKAATSQQQNSKNELLRAIRNRYYAVVSAEVSLEILRENVEYLSYALEKEQQQLEAGASTPFEVNQSKTAVASAISEYYNALRALKTARHALVLTLGIDPMLEPKIKLSQPRIPLLSVPEIALKMQQALEKFDYPSLWFPSTREFTHRIEKIDQARSLVLYSEEEAAQYMQQALESRPNLVRRKQMIQVADQSLLAKKGKYLPEIEAYARYSYNDANLGVDSFLNQDYFWTCGFVLTWQLFDGTAREHAIREARSQKNAAHIAYDDELNRIEIEIRDGLYQVEDALFAYLAANEAVQLAEQARFQAQEKLEFGRISALQYRDVVNQLALSRNLRNEASFNLISAYYDLRFATGVDVAAHALSINQ
jgi:outer membrane protein TolC